MNTQTLNTPLSRPVALRRARKAEQNALACLVKAQSYRSAARFTRLLALPGWERRYKEARREVHAHLFAARCGFAAAKSYRMIGARA